MPSTLPLLDVAPDASDAELLGAVVGHFHEALMASGHCEAILGGLGIGRDLAVELSLGLSERTLGLCLPARQSPAGALVRGRLQAMGVFRASGHEAFRSCVVVPVLANGGEVAGIFGRRIGGLDHVWAEGLPGGVFAVARERGGDTPTVVVPTVIDALAVMGAGHRFVVAPGHKKGFSPSHLAEIATRGTLVVLGRGAPGVAEKLAANGASVSVGGPDVTVAVLLTGAPSAARALGALVGSASAPASRPARPEVARPEAPGALAPVVAQGEQDRDEVFVRCPGRTWRIRGAGARGNREGDLLRVALSVTEAATGRFHLDTVDLFAARQRSGFVDAAARELRIERDELVGELAEVIAAAERRRDALEKTGPTPPPAMTDAERREAMAFLCAPDLLERLGSDLAALGVVGEQTNLVTSYLATVSRLCERPFGVLVQSSSAAGKSTLTDAVCSLVPEEDLVSLSAITPQALYYLSGGQLAHKVLAIAEEEGSARAAYALKLLVSEGRLSIASTGKDRRSGKLSTSAYEIAGPVALVMTTTATAIDPELENRMVVLGIDEDPAQTEAIVTAQKKAATLEGLVERGAREAVRRRHRNAQRLLVALPVVIEGLDASFPMTATRHRRDHMKLLSIISALTLLHQHQREHKQTSTSGVSVTYLEASFDDVANGIALATSVLLGAPEHLAPQTARLLDVVIEHTAARAAVLGCDQSDVEVTRRELRELLGWSDIQVRRTTDRLVALEYLVSAGGGRGRCRTYTYVGDVGHLGHRPGPLGQRDGPVGHRGRPGSQPLPPATTPGLVTMVTSDPALRARGESNDQGPGVIRTKARR